MNNSQKRKIWDGFVRFYHWLQVLLLGGLWWSAEQARIELHMAIGLCLLSLILARIVWGFIGSSNAQFRHFIAHPKQAWQEFKLELKGKPAATAGHSALGAYMVIALISVLLLQLGSGLFISDDLFSEGPLYHTVSEQTSLWLKDLHHSNFNLLLGLVALHVAAIGWFTLKKRQLIRAMLSGYRHSPHSPAKLRNGFIGFVVFMLMLGTMTQLFGDYFVLDGL
jgi:cytochrome b